MHKVGQGSHGKHSLMRTESGSEGESDAEPHAHHPHEQDHEHVTVDHAGELAQTDAEFLPALGISNPSDLAYRAMDMMMGIASIIPEDYPFVCICLDTGKCEENVPEDKKTPCPSRIGQKSAAAGSASGAAAFLTAVTAAWMM